MRQSFPRTIRAKPAIPDLDTLAAEILAFLGDDAERFELFLSSTGLTFADLRVAGATSSFAEGLLDHLCGNENLLVAFAASREYAPEAIEHRRRALDRASNED